MTSRTKATTEEATPQESSASLVVNSIDQYISDGQVFIEEEEEEEVITSSTTAPIETQLAPDAWQTHTLGDMDYEIPSSWLVNTDLSSSNTQCFYIGSGTHSSFVSAMLVVYAVETNPTNGMTEELFISEIDSQNNAILDDFEDSILVQYEPHGDTMPQYADVIFDRI